MEDKSNYENRDRLLGEIHQNVKSVSEWCKFHDLKDDERFKEINNKLIYAAVAIIIVAFASGVMGQLISTIKVGV